MTTSSTEPMSKAYDSQATEPKMWSKWIDNNAFHADPSRVLSGEARPYCILIPPPNVTAALHLGHALNNSIQDILIRAHRMKGYETLWMPGTDHAGIATQTMVDKKLKEAGQPGIADYKKKELAGENGREQFTQLVQDFKDEYEARITDQLQKMGCSCDWDRQRFTMDDICARAVREAFFRLFKDGLIYRGKRLVNWDPVTQTALADDEVEMEDVDGFFWYMRYPVVDDAGSETGEHVTVATTRPETFFGDTAVAVNPKDADRAKFIGKSVKLPFVNRIIPVIGDDYVVPPDPESSDSKAKYATGFLKVTPAHDPNDYMIGQRHDLPIINIMAPDASISDQHGWEDVGDASQFLGMSREDARTAVEQAFRDANLLEAKKPYNHAVGHSYRSHAPIEPYLSDQWYCKVSDDKLRGSAQRALNPDQRTDASLKEWTDSRPKMMTDGSNDGTMSFYPARYAKTYETWHDNLRDWCISRQLWWGHRIPVWHKQVDLSTEEAETFCIDSIDDVLEGNHIGDGCFGRAFDSETGLPISFEKLFPRVDNNTRTFLREGVVDLYLCDKTPEAASRWESSGFTQDPDVLDTWFSSALWPLSTMGWPNADAANSDDDRVNDFESMLSAFNPSSVLTTAREIITLWVSRMTMFNRYFLSEQHSGKAPFKDVFIHAMIQDGEGRKMSKSLGNGVDPLDIIHSHGADAMRFTLCQMTTQTQDVRMPVELDAETGKNTSPKFDIGRNLCNKLWNAAKFAMMMLEKNPIQPGMPIDPQELSLVDRWMLSRVVHATGAINTAQRNYMFKDYADAVYDLLWRDFCDWYLESIKPTVSEDPNQAAVLRAVLDAILRLMHPITPFITEAIHERLSTIPMREITGFKFEETKSTASLCQSGWPIPDDELRDEVAEEAYGRMVALTTAIREVRASNKVPPKRKVVLHVSGDLASDVSRWSPLVETLCNLKEVSHDPAPDASASFVFEGQEYRVSDLADAVDASVEKDRLTSELASLSKAIGGLEGRLSNPGYVDKAPEHLVNQTRAELEQKKQDRDSIQSALDKLG
ncbi:MAG: valine--tRNA ligase [Phycisphaerales bacterium]|nr:valine--tRNA ligase [Phycisphaerales bacterium]